MSSRDVSNVVSVIDTWRALCRIDLLYFQCTISPFVQEKKKGLLFLMDHDEKPKWVTSSSLFHHARMSVYCHKQRIKSGYVWSFKRLPKLSSSSQANVVVEENAENDIGFTENSVPYQDVFLNVVGGEPGCEYASNSSSAKSRFCVGTSVMCLLGTFIVTILVGSFIISPSVGIVTSLLVGMSCFPTLCKIPVYCQKIGKPN